MKRELRFEVNITTSERLGEDTPTHIAWLLQLILSHREQFKVDSVIPIVTEEGQK